MAHTCQWRPQVVVVGGLCGMLLGACAVPDGSVTTGVQATPDAVKSEQGALAYYQGVLDLYGAVLNDYAIESGTLTDELRPLFTSGQPNDGHPTGIDARVAPQGTISVSFGELQLVRANARQARSMLARYAPAAPKDFLGHLYAIEGLADVLLADLYCAGVPLSTVNPDGSITIKAGSTTREVYRAAATLFDSAVTLAADSARIRDFARVGEARALLALGRADSAAALVTGVPTEDVYAVPGQMLAYAGNPTPSASYVSNRGGVSLSVMSDTEGGTGLPYATSGDPRTAADTGSSMGSGLNGVLIPLLYPRYFARKYDSTGTTPMVVASGVEARLIEAEAALDSGHVASWLARLNALRAAGGIAPLPADSTTNASEALRVRVLFAERAYWLFLTGHRQGDLRRLIRQYSALGFTQSTVYPRGAYPGGGLYGRDVNLPVPDEERQRNPHYDGCWDREA